MFKDKGLLKYKSAHSKGPMHYIKLDNDVYTLTLGSSKKVKDLNTEQSLKIAPTLLSRQFESTPVEVVLDPKTIKSVFNKMLELKHTHFKKWNDDLVALNIK